MIIDFWTPLYIVSTAVPDTFFELTIYTLPSGGPFVEGLLRRQQCPLGVCACMHVSSVDDSPS